jgi:hypothetical protein
LPNHIWTINQAIDFNVQVWFPSSLFAVCETLSVTPTAALN